MSDPKSWLEKRAVQAVETGISCWCDPAYLTSGLVAPDCQRVVQNNKKEE